VSKGVKGGGGTFRLAPGWQFFMSGPCSSPQGD